MLLRLIVTTGPDAGRVFELKTGELLLVGRGDACEIQLHDPRVSKAHCRIHVEGGRVRIVDSGSRWGTVVNGQQVTEDQLQPGDLLTLGATELRVEMVSEAAATTLEPGNRCAPRKPTVPKSTRKGNRQGQVRRAQSHATRTTGPVATTRSATPPRRSVPEGGDLNDLVGGKLLQYEIGAVVARARTGMVFRAWDTREDRPVALKILWPELAQQKDEVRRFLRAIKTMLPIRHENLVALYEARKKGPYCFMASEFVDGESAAKVIERIGIGGMMLWRDALRVALHVARALEVAHQHKVVHRNITPQNILIRKSDGVAKLGDLMLAKALEGTQAEQITRPGELVGELAYMSPEQTGGVRPLDCRSDLYNLGATVYALLTGRPPFEGSSLAETVVKIQNEKPRNPREYHLSIPSRFESVVLRMLAKRPEDRYETPTRLVRELSQVAKYEGLTDSQ